MKIIYGIENYTTERPLVLGLGNFDGVHRGHQQLINGTIKRAREIHGSSGVLVFDPHPLKVLRPEKAPKLLTTTAQKARIMEDMGLDCMIITPFNLEIAAWSPERFVDEMLVAILNVEAVFVGYNHTFGHKGRGNPEMLRQLGESRGFEVNVIAPVKVGEQVVSSSLVRSCLQSGDMQKAWLYTGRWPGLEGVVVEGDKRGRSLGFPTANLQTDPDIMLPATGVYAATARVNGNQYEAVVNIGRAPTFLNNHPVTVEAHLLGFNGDLYNRQLALTLYKRLRGERKFAGKEELIAQINKDIEQAKKILDDYLDSGSQSMHD